MTTSDIRPTHADVFGPILRPGLRTVAVAMGLGLVWFWCRFIAPRCEAPLMDAGVPPSPAARGLPIASTCVARYFW